MWRNEMLGTKNERRVDRCVLLQLLSQSVSGRRNFQRSYTMFTNFETFLQWSSDVKIIENIKNIREAILWARKYFSALSLGVKFQVSILPTAKSFSPSGTRAFLETSPSPPPAGEGGGGVEKSLRRFFEILPGLLCHYYFFLGVRGASFKTIKTVLNCRKVVHCPVSTVATNTHWLAVDIFKPKSNWVATYLMYCLEIATLLLPLGVEERKGRGITELMCWVIGCNTCPRCELRR